MAAATNQPLINAVRVSAANAAVAAKWVTSGAAIDVRDSFLLEMYLLMVILGRLQGQYSIAYVAGTGKEAHEFPKGPANKKGRPRFHILDASGAVVYQVCAGTKVKDNFGVARGVDVSLQQPNAGDEPTSGDLVRIYDAKYRENSKHRIAHPELSEFARWVESFGLRALTPGDPALGDLDGHCIATNGDYSTEPSTVLLHHNIREAKDLFPGKTHKVRP